MWSVLPAPATMGAGSAIWGTSPSDYYLGDANGSLFHFDGSSYSTAFHDLSNLGITSVYESPSGKVWLASSQLFTCSGSCTIATHFAPLANYASLGCQVDAVCGNGETVYAVGSANGGTTGGANGCLLASDSLGNWSVVSLSSIPSSATACAVAPSGVVYAVGQGAIASFSWLNGATAETINWPSGSAANSAYVGFQAAWTDGVNVFAAGGNRRVFARRSSGWDPVLNSAPIDPVTDGSSTASFSAIAGAGGQAWALGGSQGTHQAAYFNGASWVYVPDIAPGEGLFAAWAADASNYYVVGTPDGVSALIVHGHP